MTNQDSTPASHGLKRYEPIVDRNPDIGVVPGMAVTRKKSGGYYLASCVRRLSGSLQVEAGEANNEPGEVCQCDKCGRSHRSLGFGKPPWADAEPHAKLLAILDGHAAKGCLEGIAPYAACFCVNCRAAISAKSIREALAAQREGKV